MINFSIVFGGLLLISFPPAYSLDAPTRIDLRKMDLVQVNKTGPKSKEAELSVFIASGTDCPAIRRYIPKIHRMAGEFSPGVSIALVYSSAHESLAAVKEDVKKYSISVPVYWDRTQNFARQIGFKITTQAVVVRRSSGEIAYRGAIDDSIGYGTRKPAQEEYLKDAIVSVLKGKRPAVPESLASGCSITFRK